MVSKIVAIYSMADEILKNLKHREEKQRQMSNVEIMTASIVAALFFRAHMGKFRVFWQEHCYVPKLLWEGQTPGFLYLNGKSIRDVKRILHDLDFEFTCARLQDVDAEIFLCVLHLWMKGRWA